MHTYTHPYVHTCVCVYVYIRIWMERDCLSALGSHDHGGWQVRIRRAGQQVGNPGPPRGGGAAASLEAQ